jgi:hypothetical protein
MNNTLDERDSAILAERQAELDTKTYPKVGDWVRFNNGEHRRITYVWSHGYQLNTQSKYGGRFYLGETGYCDYSGGLTPAIPTDTLTATGERKPAPVWFFHHNRRVAHNGIDVTAEFPVWNAGEYPYND